MHHILTFLFIMKKEMKNILLKLKSNNFGNKNKTIK